MFSILNKKRKQEKNQTFLADTIKVLADTIKVCSQSSLSVVIR